MYEDAIRARRDDKARIAALEAGLRRIKAGIEKYATDTVWIGEFETACDAIELLLGPTAETNVKPSDPERIEIARCPRCGRLPRPTLMGRTICDNCGGFDVPQSLQSNRDCES